MRTGVFETMKSRGGQILHLDEHLARLRAGAAALGLHVPDDLRVEGDGVVNVFVWPDRVDVRTRPLDPDPAWQPVVARSWTRPPGPPAWIKHTDREGWEDELLFVDRGEWTESTRGNLFVVRDGRLLTPPLDGRILPGLTRARILVAAATLGIPTCEGPVAAGSVEESYLSSTLKEMAPLVALDDHPLPGLGPIGELLRDYFAGTLGRTRSSV